MKKFGDRARLAMLLATVASPMAFAAPALAQDASATTANSDEEIVVTARRTEEQLQDVPGAVSAFNQNRLDQLGVTNPVGLQGLVPNMNIVEGRGSSNATNIFIRGIGQPDALQTFDPAVGFYVDGVYYSRIRGTEMELFDLNRVEVLRGPQGTLYGKNTIGGAMQLITTQPTQDPHYSLQAMTGTYGLLEGRVGISGPITDHIAAGVNFFGVSRDGYVTNPNTGEDYNDRNAWGGRFQTVWDVSPSFTVSGSIDYQEEHNHLTMGQATNTITTILGVPLVVVPSPVPEFDFHATPTPGLPNQSDLTHYGYALHADWNVNDNLTLRSITAYRNLRYADYVDIDATQVETGDVFVHVWQDQLSQEFQANWNSEHWNTVGGVFYMDEVVSSHQEAFADDFLGAAFGNPTFLRTIDDDLNTISLAGYVNSTYRVTDRFNITGGVRYTDERKDYNRTTSTFSSNPLFTANPAAGSPMDDTHTWHNWSGLISADYHLSDNMMVYGRVSQGFKSGGFNGRANNAGEDAPYDPETVTSYEAGAKTSWLDNRLIANLSVFYNDYRDFQARVSGITNDIPPIISLTVLNAGKLTIPGAELELHYNPINPLHLDAEIGYLDAAYDEFNDARFTGFGGSRAFQTPAFAPRWTARVGGSYRFELPLGSLTVAADANYRTRMALAVDNTPVNSAAQLPGMFQDAYWLYNASLTWDVNDRFSIAVQGRNLGDEVYRTDAQEFSSVGQIRTAYYGAPSTVNLVVTAKY